MAKYLFLYLWLFSLLVGVHKGEFYWENVKQILTPLFFLFEYEDLNLGK